MVNEESDWSDTFEKSSGERSYSTGAFCATKEIGFVALNLISFGKISLAGPTRPQPSVPIPMGLEPLIFGHKKTRIFLPISI